MSLPVSGLSFHGIKAMETAGSNGLSYTYLRNQWG